MQKYFCPVLSDIQTSIAFFQGSQALPSWLHEKSNINLKLSMQHWQNGTNREEELKYSGNLLSQCHLVYHISQMDCPKIEPRTPC